MGNDLFGKVQPAAPLAEKLRPRSLDEIVGQKHLLGPGKPLRVAFESGLVANLTASRVSSERVRKLRAFGTDQYYSVDYPTQEIKGYRLVKDAATGPRIEPASPPVEKAEPLVNELASFVAACRGKATLQVEGAAGRRALAVALDIVEATRS